MNEKSIIEELVKQLSTTRLALAQVIVNAERRYAPKDLMSIVRTWNRRAGEMSEVDWIAGTEALLVYLQLHPAKGARQALELLTAENSERASIWFKYRHLNRIRGRKSSDTYRRAYVALLEQYSPKTNVDMDINLHGAKRWAFPEFARFVLAWKSKLLRKANGSKS